MAFYSSKFTVKSTGVFKRADAQIYLGVNTSVFVRNTGNYPALVRLAISPDKKAWMNDGEVFEVPAKKLIVLVPNYSSKYITVEYRSKISCRSTNLTIWVQRQTD